MISAEERADNILLEIYAGQIPTDVWTAMFKHVLIVNITYAQREAFDAALKAVQAEKDKT